MLLQELNPGSSAVLADAAGADWIVRAIDLRTPAPDDSPVRRRGVAIAGHGLRPRRSWLLDEIQQPERILFIETQTEEKLYRGELSRSGRGELGNRQATAGSRLRFLVVQTQWAVVVRRGRQHATN